MDLPEIRQSVITFLQEMNPSLYRSLKKSKQLEDVINQKAEAMLKEMNRLTNQLEGTYCGQAPEIAREIVFEQHLKENLTENDIREWNDH